MHRLSVTINGTGFAGSYTASVYGRIPHKNGVEIALAGVCSGHFESANKFAEKFGIERAFESHLSMIDTIAPAIDNIACANHVHGAYTVEAAARSVPVIVLEKPPVVWPGFAEGRTASPETRKEESMQYLGDVLDTVRDGGSKLLYAEDFVYVDGIAGMVQLLKEAHRVGKGKVLYQTGVCAHQGSHAPAYDTPALSGGGALFNKACHPLGPVLYIKEIEGIIAGVGPIRPVRVAAFASQILKSQSVHAGEHFRIIQNVEDFGRITVEFSDRTIAEVVGHDLSISGIKNRLSIITDHSQFDIRINPNSTNELFLPDGAAAGDIVLREKLPTPTGTSFPSPNQYDAHGYVNEMNDAVLCALEKERAPQSGPMLAWDTMAILMAAYESSDSGGGFVDLHEFTQSTSARSFDGNEIPDPERVAPVYQTS